MSGHHKFSNLTARFSDSEKQSIAKKTAELKCGLALHELRKALKMSQAELGEKLKVQQPAIAKMEKRTDMYISHLRYCY